MNVIDELLSLVSEKIVVFKTMGSIIKLETRLAGLSIIPFIVTIIVLLISVMGLWLVTAFLIGYGVLLVSNSMMIAIVSVLILNIGLSLGLIKYLIFNLKNMSFEKTRAYLFHRERSTDETQQEAIEAKDPHGSKDVTISSSHGKPA